MVANVADIVPAFRCLMITYSGWQFIATAYTAGPESTGKQPGHPAYGITKSGQPVLEGCTIAVDPTVIPLGTWVYIEQIGLRRADDTGGKIKGRRVDIYMDNLNEALIFGVQTIRLHVLADII